MSLDSDALGLFLQIPQETIDQDLSSADDNLSQLTEKIGKSLKVPRDKKSPQDLSQEWHTLLVRNHALRPHERLSETAILFLITYQVEMIAQEASAHAYDKGKLRELNDAMKIIEAREGIEEDEYWRLGEGPEDYEKLRIESDKIFQNIDATVFLHILERYKFTDIIELYNSDRMSYDIKREVGRRLSFDGKDPGGIAGSMDESIHSKYGREGMILLRRLLKQEGLD